MRKVKSLSSKKAQGMRRRLGLGDASRGLFEVFVQFLKQLGVSADQTNHLPLQGCSADFFAGGLEGGEVA